MDGAMAIDVGRAGSGSRGFPVGLAGSGVLHAGFIVALLALAPIHSLVAPPEPRPISVELIPSGALDEVATPVPSLTAPTPDAEGEGPTRSVGGVMFATTFYTARLLATAEMAQVRSALPTLDRSERMVQLCNIEALEQIRRAAPEHEPDTLVSYAFGDNVMAGLTLTAIGGAFRSRRQWYRVSFECTVAPGFDGVTSFIFKLGDAIPAREWEAHNLNAEDKVE